MAKRKVPRGKSLRSLLPYGRKGKIEHPFSSLGLPYSRLPLLLLLLLLSLPPYQATFYFLHPHTTPRKPTLLAAGAHKKTTKTKQATCLLSGWVLAGTMEDLVAAAFFPLLRSDRSVFDRRPPRLRPHLSLLPIPFSLFPHPKPKAPFLLARRKKRRLCLGPFFPLQGVYPRRRWGEGKGKRGRGAMMSQQESLLWGKRKMPSRERRGRGNILFSALHGLRDNAMVGTGIFSRREAEK